MTEGVLRAMHRKEAPPPPEPPAPRWPFRTFRREDAAPLCRGGRSASASPLLPTSWIFGRGSRSGFRSPGRTPTTIAQVPHGRPPLLTLQRGGERASALDLPLRPWRGGAVAGGVR